MELPLATIRLRNMQTGEECDAQVIELTRWLAYRRIDYQWWRYKDHGPFADPSERLEPEDRHWRWGSIVRRLRKNPFAVIAAVQTSDNKIQGAIIYRLDGLSVFDPGQGAVFIEYLATAPRNRKTYVKHPLYKGVGGGLLLMAIFHSHLMGFEGRVNFYALPRAAPFYKEHKFLETGEQKDRMMHYEIRAEDAVQRLKAWGLI